MTDKPWTKSGLSLDERTELLHWEQYLTYSQTLAVREALDAHARDAAPKWTAVAEGLPWGPDAVLTCDQTGTRCLASYRHRWYPTLRDFEPTHWMPLPSPPTEDAP